jgi:LemA protein
METSNISKIIKTAYGDRYRLSSYNYYDSPVYKRQLRNIVLTLQSRWTHISVIILLVVAVGASIFYYNVLIMTEQDVMAARGKINTMLQRRNDISINLSKAVFDYSSHERNVFTAVVMLRSLLGNNDSNEKIDAMLKQIQSNPTQAFVHDGLANIMSMKNGLTPDVLASLSKLMAVAEQYPDLKLSSTFQSLMAALVDIEKDLATERIDYNNKVNIYTTKMASFPTNFYAFIFGFKEQPYYEATGNAKTFVPIHY